MPPERWQRIEDLYRAARERAPDERPRFLAATCAGDADLRRQVELRLDQDSQTGGLHPSDDRTRTAIVGGSQLGPYRIQTLLGRGGMGEVFSALDTRLDRHVAIKVCSGKFSDRFAREARTIAALNHPHICTLHDVGPNYLVMELIAGETLAERIARAPLPLDLVVRYGGQIADALTAAHSKGIVHRDLKPGNIMVTNTGVKVLDFGLAKAPQDETVTATQHIVGTPAYMSPEQRQGRPCDSRSDIYSLGLVLYEMATGKRPSHSVSNSMPERFAQVVQRCMAEDPDARWQSANEVKTGLELVAHAESSKRPHRRLLWAFAAALVMIGVLVLFFALQRYWRGPADSPVVRLAIPLPEEGVNAEPPGMVGPPAISPDGKAVVVALGPANNRAIWIRRFDTGRFERLPGVDRGDTPFWSPDSRHIAYFTAGGRLLRVPVAGGSLQTICSVPSINSIRGAAWSSSGDIIYAVNFDGLYRVPERGGNPAKIASLDASLAESSLRNPAFLADGLHFLCFSRTDRLEKRGLYLYTLDGSAPRKKLAITDQQVAVGRDSRSGREYALYSKDTKLWAQAMEPRRWELTGEPIQIDEDVGLFSVSNTGTLVYRRTNVEQGQYTWYDRTGRELGAVGEPVDSWDTELSPDDRYVAFQNHRSLDGHFSIWLIDTTRNVSSPFSVQTERSFSPVWSSDSGRVYFTSARSIVSGGRRVTFVKAVDDAAPERPLETSGATFLDDLSPDGKYFVGTLFLTNQARSLVYSEFGRETWQPLAKADGSQQRPHFSPDGRWVAYDSDESGATEVYVVDFPAARRKQRISTAGGKEPRWTRDGREIVYYASEGALMSVPFTGGAAGLPKRLFHIRFSTGIDGFHYALSRDGQRVLAMKEVGVERSRNLTVVMNWPTLLRRE